MTGVRTAPSCNWKPLADLPPSPSELSSGELEALQLVWTEQQAHLAESDALKKLLQQLRREWSIEAGILEGLYTLDRGTTQILIERGIDASLIPHEATNGDPAMVARLVRSHQETLEEMFAAVDAERALTIGYIKELHAALLRHQDTVRVLDQFGNPIEKKVEKGRYKETPDSITRPDGSTRLYCPPEQVAPEMDRLIVLHGKHMQNGVPPEVEAAWLHHGFARIHPFGDGNRRVARAIATFVFLKAKLFPLIVRRDDRTTYLEALELADQGNLRPLVSLFTEIQKRSIISAIELRSQARPAQTVDEAIGAARAVLVAKGQIPPKEWNEAKSCAERLVNIAQQTFDSVAQKLRSEIASVRPGFEFGTSLENGVAPAPLAIAKQFHYVANLQEYHRWINLRLRTERDARLTLSFHCLGSQFRGVIAASAFLETRDNGPVAVTEDIFRINYKEEATQAAQRFRTWLEPAIVKGLTLWRERL